MYTKLLLKVYDPLQINDFQLKHSRQKDFLKSPLFLNKKVRESIQIDFEYFCENGAFYLLHVLCIMSQTNRIKREGWILLHILPQ